MEWTSNEEAQHAGVNGMIIHGSYPRQAGSVNRAAETPS